MLEERSDYHSVPLSEKQPANYTPPFGYKPSTLSEWYDSTTFAYPRSILARSIPQDGRIKLAFDLHWQAKKDEHEWDMEPWKGNEKDNEGCKKYLQEEVEARIRSLESFQKEIQPFGKFIVWDADPSKPVGGHIIYDLGRSDPCVVLPEENTLDKQNRGVRRIFRDDVFCEWLDNQTWFGQPTESDKTAPWKRIILCQGLSLVSPARMKEQSFPFLVFNDKNDPINMATSIHLSCERRGGSESMNLYSNPHTAFHITFYERLMEENLEGLTTESLSSLIKESREKKLRIGHLYGKPRKNNGKNGKGDGGGNADELAFRQSSFTVITTARDVQKDPQPQTQSIVEGHWTMLILSPSGFFRSPTEIEPDKDWKLVMGQRSQQTAEFSIIVYALKKVEERWRQFNEYIGGLLVQDFMDPEAYTELLFDDETLSQSKLYFWAIGCLNEFNVSIEDNIKQVKLFRMSWTHRPSQYPSPTSPLEQLLPLDKEVEKIIQSLEGLKAQFEAKLVTIQALRDGLFNATSVREASQGTRLAKESSRQNRYIFVFTIATVFYLPISFVSTSYGMHLFDPDGNSVKSQTPFIVTAILLSLATYAMAGWGLWLVDHGHRGNPKERTQDQSPQGNWMDGLGVNRGNGCLNFLRRRGKNSEAV